MSAGADTSSRTYPIRFGISPSSARQLPILAALYARSPTLFAPIIHDCFKKVNTFLSIYLEKLKKIR